MQPETLLVHEVAPDGPALDAAGAARILRGQELGGLSVRRLLGRLQPDRLRGLDLIFVPHWYCSFRVVLDGPAGAAPTAAAPGSGRPVGTRVGAIPLSRAEHVAPAVWTMVEALAGKVLRLAGEPPLVARDLAALAPAVALPPRLGREEAGARAARELGWDLRVRGRQRFAPRAIELAEARLAHVPFWVGYYTGPGGQLRARAVHGVERSLQDEAFTRELLRALETVA